MTEYSVHYFMPNVLAQERSAYLRQHQANPVDWLPWGEAALKRARVFNKPILLSIGYSACHWCHVSEVLKYVHEAYKSAPDANEQKGQELVAELIKTGRPARRVPALTSDAIIRIAEDLLTHVDLNHGGLVGAPKFPYPALFRFLWNQGVRSNRADFQDAVVLTLDKIALGGLFDHIGGGFFRYAVDTRWGIPLFRENALRQCLTQLRHAKENTVDTLPAKH
jgi:uncharacterized protein YyaL (SSP411 family)